jgi:hypothetical protein
MVLPACEKAEGKEKAKRVLELVMAQHERLSKKADSQIHLDNCKRIEEKLKSDHVKINRLGHKEKRIMDQAGNKKKNANQKRTGVNTTDAIAGLVRFGIVRKVIFTNAVNEELDFHEISRRDKDCKGKDKETILSEKLKHLKAHEAKQKNLKVEEVEAFESFGCCLQHKSMKQKLEFSGTKSRKHNSTTMNKNNYSTVSSIISSSNKGIDWCICL